MTTRAFRLLLPGVLVLPVIAANVGGWAAITVEDLPDHVVARQPVTLAFTAFGFAPVPPPSRYPPEFPKPFRASPTGQMPNLHLKPLEIAALAAFLNAGGAGAGQ